MNNLVYHRTYRQWVLSLFLVAALISSGRALHATEDEPDKRRPVLTVLGRDVFSDELVSEKASERMKIKLNAEAYDAWLARARADNAQTQVWSAVINDYLAAKNVEPKQDEIETHLDYSRKVRKEKHSRLESERETLAAELKSPSISASRSQEVKQQLDSISAQLGREAQAERETSDTRRDQIQRAVERRKSEALVKKWKKSQALYREFGGRIVFRKEGWEPIDAYRRLMERYEAKKAVQFHDALLREAFFKYFNHDLIYADEKQARFYFEKPFWERSVDEMRAAGFKNISEMVHGETAE